MRGLKSSRETFMNSSRRQLVRYALGLGALSNCMMASAARLSLGCTPAPTFPVPLTEGIWRSPAFPVGKHAYNISLNVDRRLPLEQLDCDLGPPRSGEHCDTPPLLDIEWKIWNGTTLVKSWPFKPIQASSWGAAETGCMLGGFEGIRNGHFVLEWNVKKDAGRLKDLHPRVEIVKNPGYWCWL